VPPQREPAQSRTAQGDALPTQREASGQTAGQPGGPTTVQPGQRAAPGVIIGDRYALRTAIGHGGMGTVWRATDTVLRRDVAVKEVLLPAGMAAPDRDSMYQRTLREARAAAALSHPAVVQVYDVVTEGGRPWIVMELLQARSLAEMIVEDGPLAPRAVAKIGIALLGALEVAHAAGVLHRDVKPANVLICADGRCVLTDFGVARMPTDAELTTPGMVLGSPHFISPERAVGAKFGPPSDLFSLGVTLYTAVEGRPPFDKRDPFETMRAVVEEPPTPALRAGALSGVLYGLLEKDPGRRWDIDTSRTVLRDLLVGPLASTATAHVTDPYAVVRQAPYAPPPPQPQQPPSGQVGGRAMLAPGETISEAHRRLGGGPPPAGTRPAYDPAGYDPDAYEPGYDPAYDHDPGYGWHQPPPPPAPVKVRTPRWLVPAIAAGLVAALLFGVGMASGWFGGGDGNGQTPQGQSPTKASAAPAKPLIDVQEFHDDKRGITVNVPKTWTKGGTANYTDFTDPNDRGRRLRINVEPATNHQAFLAVAEDRLKKNASNSCVAPYTRIALNDVQLDNKPAGELEYTCGEGDAQRHVLWRSVVLGGKSYHFYLTVPQAKFDDSKVIYDEMVRSFKVVPPAATPSGGP
jgi:hypothetical protein